MGGLLARDIVNQSYAPNTPFIQAINHWRRQHTEFSVNFEQTAITISEFQSSFEILAEKLGPV